MNTKKDVEKAVYNILQFLTDSKTCFEKHVHNVNDRKLKETFKKYLASRNNMIREIKNEFPEYAGDIAPVGTILGKTHMLFENLKAYILNGDALSITKEVRRGEGVLIEYYKNALALELPSKMRETLLAHLKQIQQDIAKADILSIS